VHHQWGSQAFNTALCTVRVYIKYFYGAQGWLPTFEAAPQPTGKDRGVNHTCLLPVFSALTMFLRASLITDILTILYSAKARLAIDVKTYSV
jgi:hypothetical protein